MAAETQRPVGDGVEERTKLIDVTYREVLDATKHQDDKIGRLLTAIAFLTAASLALAGLRGGSLVTRRFDAHPYELPLALIALVVFLVAVVFAVVLLVAGFATPLRLPGLGSLPTNAAIEWVTPAKGSQLYFGEIAGLSLAEWSDKWARDISDLERERLGSYIAETHNLAVRTNFKYNRTTEAIAVFSFGMVSLGLAIVLIFWAATDNHDPLPMSVGPRITLAALLAAYCFVQMTAQLRYRRQTVEEVVTLWEWSEKGRTALAERLYAGLFAVAVGTVVASPPTSSRWAMAVVGAFGVGAAVCFARATFGTKRRRRHLAYTLPMAGGLVGFALWTLALGSYALQLLAAYLATIVLIGQALGGPSFATARRRHAYVERRLSVGDAAAGGSEESGAGR